MIKRILSRKINTISSAAILVAFSSLLSRLLGVVRDRILASQFGASDQLDVYYAAFRIPDMVFNLIVLGALSAGFIPVFAKTLASNKERKESWDLANNVMNTFGLVLLVISVLAITFASPLSLLVSPGFSADKQQAVVILTRIMFLSPLLLGLSSIVGGILQSYKSFVAYSFAPIMYNLGIIVGAVYFVPIFGITGLAWGVILGAFLHLIIQLPTLFHLGYGYRAFIDFKSQKFQSIVKMMVPRTMSLAISQLDLLISTAIASTLAVGSLAVLNFANNLQFFPIGIFGISIATAAFPFFSEHSKDKVKLVGYFSQVIGQVLFFIVPSAVFMFLLRNNITHVILGSGLYDEVALNTTNNILAFYLISLFAQAIIPTLVRMFYARENSRTPFYVGMITVILNVFLAFVFSRIWGVAGIALAFSIASILNFILLWLMLRQALGSLNESYIFKTGGKSLLSASISGAVVYLILLMLSSYEYGYLLPGLISGFVGLITYILIARILKSSEAIGLINKFNSKISFSRFSVTDSSEARGL
jgi:putative peptidoglycan lipid II flippase